MRTLFRKRNLFIALSISILLGFEWYWLKMAYEREVHRIESESSRVLLSATRKKEAKVYEEVMERRMAAYREGKEAQIFPKIAFMDSLPPGEILDSMVYHGHKQNPLPIPDTPEEIEQNVRKHKKMKQDFERMIKLLMAKEGKDTANPKIRSMTFERSPFDLPEDKDSIRTWVLAEYHTTELPENFEIHQFRGPRVDTERDPRVQGILHSQSFHVKFTGSSFMMGFRDYNGFVIRQLIPEISLCILVLGSIIFSFFMLIRSQRKTQEISRMKSDFISNMTHNLKTPIATVSVALEALRNFGVANNPERTREYLSISTAELERLSSMVDKTLKVSSMMDDQFDFELQTHDLQPVIQDALAMMQPQFDKHGIEIRKKIPEGPQQANIDPEHFLNALVNLLENSVKYRGQNPWIEVEVESRPNTLRLSVADNGIGIPKKYRKHIFDNFYRAPSLKHHPSSGNGMGLAYVKTVVRKLGGQIRVDSEEGRGTRMSLEIPRQHAFS